MEKPNVPFRTFVDLDGNETYIPLTAEEIAEREARAYALSIPKEVTPYQARIALLQAGYLDAVEALMANPETPAAARIAWEYAISFQRHSAFINALASALGLTEEQIDNLFRSAAQVV